MLFVHRQKQFKSAVLRWEYSAARSWSISEESKQQEDTIKGDSDSEIV